MKYSSRMVEIPPLYYKMQKSIQINNRTWWDKLVTKIFREKLETRMEITTIYLCDKKLKGYQMHPAFKDIDAKAYCKN